MFVAKEKRKENIAEYILYMFQVEDLIRSFKMDMDLIRDHLISHYRVKESQRQEVADWYANLVRMMDKEGIAESGHLQFLVNHINDLNEFHLRILQQNISPEYAALFNGNIGLMNEFRLKGNAYSHDIETCLNAIYGYLLLKMQNKEITTGTEQAIKQFANQLAVLSKLFRDYEKGDLEL
jgi:hypothetical protein